MPYKDPEQQKAYRKEYYARTKDASVAYSLAFIRNRRKENKEFLDAIKSTTPCTDCSSLYPPYVMQFDHLPGFVKRNAVAVLSSEGVSIQTLKDEIAKCELVCANCHAIRTHERRNIPL